MPRRTAGISLSATLRPVLTPSKAAFLTGTLIILPLIAGEVAAHDREFVTPPVHAFSAGKAGKELPPGWRAWTFGRHKKATEYRLISDGGKTVLEASADASASGLQHDIRMDPKEFRWIKWRWKIAGLISGADNTRRSTEDSPVRVIVTFQGDKARFSLADKVFAAQIWMLTDYELPYATLMYIWENRAPKGSVIPNLHTSRIKMIVVESGNERIGQWLEEVRNVYEDYRLAFGEEPSMTRSVGIMTDADNTKQKASAYYGDIAFQRAEK